MAEIVGRCHCGNLSFDLQTKIPLQQLPIRACTCSFCKAHGAKCTSDPDGQLRIIVHEDRSVIRYQFGKKTADFLLCGKCGCYLDAILHEGDKSWSTVNLRLTAFSEIAAEPVSYDEEAVGSRIKRRKARWTPVIQFRKGEA